MVCTCNRTLDVVLLYIHTSIALLSFACLYLRQYLLQIMLKDSEKNMSIKKLWK